ncbi:MAG TPA: hypothetical protein VF958_03505 [Thermoanaerobaculia bacterium]
MRRSPRAIVLAVLLTVVGGCSRRTGAPKPAPPLSGDAVWFADGLGAGDVAIEETLARFHCAAVYLPARLLTRGTAGWSGSDRPAPVRALSRVPVVLVVSATEDPFSGAGKKRDRELGGLLAREVGAALAREREFGRVRGVHLDLPFSAATAETYAAALREARSQLSHLLARGGATSGAPARNVPISISLRIAAPAEEKEQKAVRALASRSDGIVAFVFGKEKDADPAFVDALGKVWWAGYESASGGVVRRSSGDPGPRVPEAALDPLTDDPRTELVLEVPWNEGRGSQFTLRAMRALTVAGVSLAAGDSVVFTEPSLPDLVSAFRQGTSGRRLARGRILVVGGEADDGRIFPVAALDDVIGGRRAAPKFSAWTAAEGSRLLRVGADNPSPHASVVSRIENWIDVDFAPARIGDVELGGFDRWEAHDEGGRPVSPGRATRVRLFETFVAPFERIEPARLRARGNLPSSCCRMRTHVGPAAGGEVATDWEEPGALSGAAKPTPSP